MKKGWKTYLSYAGIIISSTIFLYVIVQTIRAKNTGFETKTLWDWMELLIIPLVLAVGAFYLNRSERALERQRIEERTQEERRLAEARANIEREIATDRQQEYALQTYLDHITELLLKEKLLTTTNKDVRKVARIRTLAVLRGLDSKRKGLVMNFLNESGLIIKGNPIIDLDGADLQNANLRLAMLNGTSLAGVNLENADLSLAFLSNADLSFSHLKFANLEYASLDNANLYSAHLNDANLSNADLENADLRQAQMDNVNLSNANLEGVKVIELSLAFITTKSLKGATMPDGTKHK